MPDRILNIDDLPHTANRTGWPWTFDKNHCPDYGNVENKKLPKICIVTPSYNQCDYLEKTIRTVLLQQYPNLQYIVIDGGSSDGSVEILKGYDRHIDYWISEADSGQSGAINKGFAHANSDCEIYMWLCSDDLLMPGALTAIGNYFADNPNCQWLCGRAAHVNIDSDDEPTYFPAGLVNRNALMDFWRLGEPGRFIKQSSVAWRSSLWSKVGPLREDLHLAMDHDLWLKFNEVSPMHTIKPLISLAQLHDDCKSVSATASQQREAMRCCYEAYDRLGKSRIALTLRMLYKLPLWRISKIFKNFRTGWYGGIANEIICAILDPFHVWTENGRMKIIFSRPLF